MAKSKAKKYREKLEREGRRNPENSRVSWAIDPTERKTKTKTEKIRQMEKQENSRLKRDFNRSLF